MDTTEYNNLTTQYLKEGILKKSMDFAGDSTAFEYQFNKDVKGTLFPYFDNDSLKELNIIISVKSKSDSALQQLDTWISSNYSISKTEQKEGEVKTFYTSDQLMINIDLAQRKSYDQIWAGVGFCNVTEKYPSICYQIGHFAEVGFLRKIRNCEEAERLAESDFANGIYRVIQFGLPEESSVRRRKAAMKLCSIDIRFGGCISSDEGNCYSDKMWRLLFQKYGSDLMRNIGREARNIQVSN